MVESPRGKQIVSMGVTANGERTLSPEETLYLLEQGLALVIEPASDEPLSVFEFYQHVNVPRYLVYTELRKNGFAVSVAPPVSVFDMTAVRPTRPTECFFVKVALSSDPAPLWTMHGTITELHESTERAILAVVSGGEVSFLELLPFLPEHCSTVAAHAHRDERQE